MSESPAIQQLRGRVSKILMSEECQSINFALDNVVVNGSAFSYVALALVSKPSFKGGMRFNLTPSPGAEANYDPANNTFSFPKTDYAVSPGFEQVTVVHEATHALVDATSAKKKVLMITNEMVAFIAESLFNAYCGSPYVAPVTDKIPFEAQKLAMKMLTVASKANYTGCYALGASDVASLRAAILAHPIYQFIKWNPKGSYGDNGLALS